jgi:hypothetical protein
MTTLSIDIDVLFDEMNTYQKYMDVDLTPKQSWLVIGWKCPTLTYKHNTKCLEKILNIISRKCKQSTIHTIQEHDEILNIIKSDTDSSLYSIDYHHDITYLNDDTQPNIENWVTHGIKNGYIKDYTWITRPDALCPIRTPIQYNIGILDTFDIDTMPDFDRLIICTSKHFTPVKSWHFNKLLYDFAKENSCLNKQ